MAIEDQQKRIKAQQAQAQELNQVHPKKGISRRLVISLILILVVLNGGIIYWMFVKAKASADSLGTATNSSFSLKDIGSAKLPSQDVEGVEISGIQRYRGAVRTKYDSFGGVISAEYQTKDPVNLVLGYYKTQLAKNNWIIVSSNQVKIVFQKESKNISVEASAQKGITTFTIIY